MQPTVKQLKRFVKMRNANYYHSNLQFQIDADACGFSVNDLPKALRFETEDGGTGYRWALQCGVLFEEAGTLRFEAFDGR